MREDRAKRTDWHPADVIAALHKAGWSLRRLALAHGLRPGTFNAALHRSYPHAENAIAQALGLSISAIWPERERLRVARRKRLMLAPSKRAAHINAACISNR